MLGSSVLEVALGLVFVFLVFALFLTSFQEVLEIWLKTRAVTLEQGLRQLLHDPDAKNLLQKFYDQPLISGLFKDDYASAGPRDLPSYIPAQLFVAALLDLEKQGVLNDPVKRVVEAARASAGADLDALKKHLEDWYNGAMDRIAGVYKRKTQIRVLIMAAVVSIGLNVNTLTILQSLSQDDALRTAIAAQAEARGKAPAPQPEATYADLRSRYAEIEGLGLPIGWTARNQAVAREALTNTGGRWGWLRAVAGGLQLLAGWVLTAVAISLGAPFWFDVLNRIMVLRATVKPTEKSPPEASEDRQT